MQIAYHNPLPHDISVSTSDNKELRNTTDKTNQRGVTRSEFSEAFFGSPHGIAKTGVKQKGRRSSENRPLSYVVTTARVLRARRLKRATVNAALGVEIRVLHQSEAATVFASARETLDFDFQARYTVAFSFFFFSHYIKPPFHASIIPVR
jgi:hypothetical protein